MHKKSLFYSWVLYLPNIFVRISKVFFIVFLSVHPIKIQTWNPHIANLPEVKIACV